ncbi:hypothetical protein Tco_1284024 [Tanacetum coccineum]
MQGGALLVRPHLHIHHHHLCHHHYYNHLGVQPKSDTQDKPTTYGLVDAGYTALPSPPLLPLSPSLYIPPPVDRKDDIPESERPPSKRSCLFALGPKYEVGESSTARPTRGRVGNKGCQHLKMLKQKRRGLESMEDRIGESYWNVEEDAYASQSLAHSHSNQVHENRLPDQPIGWQESRETDHRRKAHMVEILRVMRDMRREMGDMQAELLALREQRRRARQPGSDARVLDHQDASRDVDSHI